jgi:hypothetical protein
MHSAAMVGAPPVIAVSHGRVYRSALIGVGAVGLQPLLDVTVEPLTTVTFAAALLGGGAADSYTWRRVSGPAITFFGSGASRSFRAPAEQFGATIVIGVTATVDGVTSAERTATVTVRPQIMWERRHGGDWLPARLIT